MCGICGCNKLSIAPNDGIDFTGLQFHADESKNGSTSALQQSSMPNTRRISIEVDIMQKNDQQAVRNRDWFKQHNIVAINMLSAPGSGKTTLLERSIRERGQLLGINVIEGDQETDCDADRIRSAGAPVIQVNTGAGCHLDASMIERSLESLYPSDRRLLMIENVGNLVCPALFDLGENARVVVASVTEGEDKPLKYPHMFRSSDVVILNKIDLLQHVAFDVTRFRNYLQQINSKAVLMPLSALTGQGMEAWYSQLNLWMKRS